MASHAGRSAGTSAARARQSPAAIRKTAEKVTSRGRSGPIQTPMVSCTMLGSRHAPATAHAIVNARRRAGGMELRGPWPATSPVFGPPHGRLNRSLGRGHLAAGDRDGDRLGPRARAQLAGGVADVNANRRGPDPEAIGHLAAGQP